MSEINTGQPGAERQLSIAERTRKGVAIALAGILPIAFPVLHEEEVVWEETVTEKVVIPGTTSNVSFTQSATEIQDNSGDYIPKDEVVNYLTFHLTESDEKDKFAEAVKRIVEPDSTVQVTRDGDDILIRTDDYAEHPSLDPKDNEAQVLEIGIDGKLVYGEKLASRIVQNPDEILLVEDTEEHRVPVPVIFYPLAILPERPEIVDEGGEEGADQLRPKKIRRRPSTPLSPEDETAAEVSPQVEEDSTIPEGSDDETYEPDTIPPLEPETVDEEPEPSQTNKSEIPGNGGGVGEASDTQGRTRIPTTKEVYDEYIRQTTTARARGTTTSSDRGESWLLNFSTRFPRLRGFLIPIVTGSVLIGGVYAWHRAEFESVEDCELATPEQPFNIEKESDEWLPEITKPDCHEPNGHEVRVTFDGFEQGYGTGWISSKGKISEVISVPKSAMPDVALDYFAGDEFTSQVQSLMSKVDQARQQTAKQTTQEHTPFNR